MKKLFLLVLSISTLAAIGSFAGGQDDGGGTTSTGTTTTGPSGAGGYFEAPWFAEMVARGDLEPVDQRLPRNPLVVRPGDGYGWAETGTYGSGAVLGSSADVANIQGLTTGPLASHRFEVGVILPWAWEDCTGNADNTVWTCRYREGMKWSDGEDFTVDDTIFWHEHVQRNDEYMTAIGEEDLNVIAKTTTRIEKVNDWTARFHLEEANARFDALIAERSERQILHHPEHFLAQFHPDFADATALANKVSAGGFDGWTQLFYFTWDRWGSQNPETPHIIPWVPRDPPPANPTVFTANPYWFIVDDQNQQLPYLEEHRFFMVSDNEAQKLRLLSGGDTIGNIRTLDALPLARDAKARGTIDFGLCILLAGGRLAPPHHLLPAGRHPAQRLGVPRHRLERVHLAQLVPRPPLVLRAEAERRRLR